MSETRTYIILLYLSSETTLTISTLGTCDLSSGYYAYVDTVMNTDQLTQRLKHHLSPMDIPRSDIDFIQQVAIVEEIWLSSGEGTQRDDWADLLIDIPGSLSVLEEFGGADLDDDWDSYLFFFEVRPTFADFAHRLQAQFSNEVALRAYHRQDDEMQETAT